MTAVSTAEEISTRVAQILGVHSQLMAENPRTTHHMAICALQAQIEIVLAGTGYTYQLDDECIGLDENGASLRSYLTVDRTAKSVKITRATDEQMEFANRQRRWDHSLSVVRQASGVLAGLGLPEQIESGNASLAVARKKDNVHMAQLATELAMMVRAQGLVDFVDRNGHRE